MFLTSVLTLALVNLPLSTTPSVPLWNGPAPFSHGTTPDDTPRIDLYLPAKTAAPAPAIIICPGGGYRMLSPESEGSNEAQWFQQRGVAAFVLFYRLPVHGYLHPVPMLDAQRAVRLVRAHAAEWNRRDPFRCRQSPCFRSRGPS
jgi:acetyl esterase/lipase